MHYSYANTPSYRALGLKGPGKRPKGARRDLDNLFDQVARERRGEPPPAPKKRRRRRRRRRKR